MWLLGLEFTFYPFVRANPGNTYTLLPFVFPSMVSSVNLYGLSLSRPLMQS